MLAVGISYGSMQILQTRLPNEMKFPSAKREWSRIQNLRRPIGKILAQKGLQAISTLAKERAYIQKPCSKITPKQAFHLNLQSLLFVPIFMEAPQSLQTPNFIH